MNFTAAPHAPLLGINIDHVATLRNARGGGYPDPVQAAVLAEQAGADIITFHLREDRRHIKDDDVDRLKARLHVPLNFEAAVTDEMLAIIERTRPQHVCLVPERRQEVTTEGGLDVAGQSGRIQAACERLTAAGCRVSLFIGADPRQIEASARCGAPCIELHTGAFANAWWARDSQTMHVELERLKQGLLLARALGLRTHAGHGLALWSEPAPQPFASSTAQVAALADVAELHIGHALIGHAVFVGLRQAVADFQVEALRARGTAP
jgi:pyridoxine 5-phosphate synthase